MIKKIKKLENKFFLFSKEKQKIFQVKLGLSTIALIFILALILGLINVKLLPLAIVGIPIIMSLIAPFFDVPSLIKKGDLKYYSLFLLAEKKNKGVIKIHGGTLFDYYFVFDDRMNGKERTKIILLEYLKGLINLISDEDDSTKIKGTSYIINEKTANKIGLQKAATDNFQTFILLFNYFSLMASMYLAKGVFSFPNLNNINTYEAEVRDIKKKEEYINQLINKIENSLQL